MRMRYISLNKKSDSDNPKFIFRTKVNSEDLVEELIISKSKKYNGCSNCKLPWLSKLNCPSDNGELSLSKVACLISKSSSEIIYYLPYCIRVDRFMHHSSLFIMSLAKKKMYHDNR